MINNQHLIEKTFLKNVTLAEEVTYYNLSDTAKAAFCEAATAGGKVSFGHTDTASTNAAEKTANRFKNQTSAPDAIALLDKGISVMAESLMQIGTPPNSISSQHKHQGTAQTQTIQIS